MSRHVMRMIRAGVRRQQMPAIEGYTVTVRLEGTEPEFEAGLRDVTIPLRYTHLVADLASALYVEAGLRAIVDGALIPVELEPSEPSTGPRTVGCRDEP